MVTTPRSMVTIAMTLARIGRSMKNRENIGSPEERRTPAGYLARPGSRVAARAGSLSGSGHLFGAGLVDSGVSAGGAGFVLAASFGRVTTGPGSAGMGVTFKPGRAFWRPST